MTQSDSNDDRRGLRLTVYLLLITSAAGLMIGRIANTEADHGRTPFHSANDRSRWAAIRALVDHGTFYIDDVIYDRQRDRVNKDWDSIDKVRHVGWDGKEHYYSSKPPLLILLLSAEYQVVQWITGTTLAENPFSIARIMLVITNVAPLCLAWWWLALTVDRYGTTDWGRLFTMAAAVFGTFLTTMVTTLNNHSIAAVSVIASICLLIPLWNNESKSPWRIFALAVLAAFAAANEIPALSFMGLAGLLSLWKQPTRTLIAGVPGVVLVGAAFFGANYYVHGSLKMPYAHRSDGEIVYDGKGWAFIRQGMVEPLREPFSVRIEYLPEELAALGLSEQTVLEDAEGPTRWKIWDPKTGTKLAVTFENGINVIRRWDNWYEYEGSYWMTPREGVDRGEESRGIYLFHMLLGHNGWFSLTPIWLIAFLGALLVLREIKSPLWPIALMAVVLLVVCVTFYVTRPQIDRNYGGVATGFRWLFWLIPVWTACLLPAMDRFAGSRLAQGIALFLLAASAFSAAYGAMNPWTHPWLYDYWTSLQWISY